VLRRQRPVQHVLCWVHNGRGRAHCALCPGPQHCCLPGHCRAALRNFAFCHVLTCLGATQCCCGPATCARQRALDWLMLRRNGSNCVPCQACVAHCGSAYRAVVVVRPVCTVGDSSVCLGVEAGVCVHRWNESVRCLASSRVMQLFAVAGRCCRLVSCRHGYSCIFDSLSSCGYCWLQGSNGRCRGAALQDLSIRVW
jgi:hypothetical protein